MPKFWAVSQDVSDGGVNQGNFADLWLTDRQDCACLGLHQELKSRAAIHQERQCAQWRRDEEQHEKIHPSQPQICLRDKTASADTKSFPKAAPRRGFTQRETRGEKSRDMWERSEKVQQLIREADGWDL